VNKIYSVAVVNVADLLPELEICCIDLLHCKARCSVIGIYRAPKSLPRLLECLSKLCNVKYNCVITGDFNCPSIDWVLLTAPADSSQDALLDFAVTQGPQIVQASTRRDNLLDIILTKRTIIYMQCRRN